MTDVVVGEEVWTRLSELTATPVEAGAALFLHRDQAAERFLVRSVVIAQGDDCSGASSTAFTYAPQFLSRVTRIARDQGCHLALFHTHPSGYPDFSDVDDETEARLLPFMRARLPDRHVFSLMMCDQQLRARYLGILEGADVVRVGPSVHRFAATAPPEAPDEVFDRQVRAFGAEGQATLHRMTVAMVGLGGTGSLVAQQLAHLGVGRLTFIDGDVIEATNLNRVVGATAESIGTPKVEVAQALVQRIRPATTVRALQASVMTPEARDLLCQADCVMVCTDSHASRAFVNELAYQYLVPVIDMGVSISASDGQISAVTGRTQMVGPGLPCLWCTNAISTRAVREEMQSPAERMADPYFQGQGVCQPAVISLNSTMASLAVTMLLGVFTGVPAEPRHQAYDALRGTVRTFAFRGQAMCGICGQDGVTALGDHRPLSLLLAGRA